MAGSQETAALHHLDTYALAGQVVASPSSSLNVAGVWHRRFTVLKRQKEREVRDLQRRQDEEIADYQLQLQQKGTEITDYHQVQQQGMEIAAYQFLQQKGTAQRQKDKEIADYQLQLQQRDKEIADYQLQLQQKDTAQHQKDKEIADYQLQFQQKDKAIADYQLQLQQKDTAQHQKDKEIAELKGNLATLQEVATSACELWFSETTSHQCQGRTGTNCLQGRVQEGLTVSLTFHKERGCCLLVVTAIS